MVDIYNAEKLGVVPRIFCDLYYHNTENMSKVHQDGNMIVEKIELLKNELLLECVNDLGINLEKKDWHWDFHGYDLRVRCMMETGGKYKEMFAIGVMPENNKDNTGLCIKYNKTWKAMMPTNKEGK